MASSAVLMVSVGAGSPAHAADPSGLSPADQALIPFQAEIMVLVELHAFADDPLPPAVQQVHDQWASYAQGIPREGLVDWLTQSDIDGSMALNRLVAELGSPSPLVAHTLHRLPQPDLDAVAQGGHIAISAVEYAGAWSDLTYRDGKGPSPVTSVVPSGVTPAPITIAPEAPAPTVAPVATVARRTAPSPATTRAATDTVSTPATPADTTVPATTETAASLTTVATSAATTPPSMAPTTAVALTVERASSTHSAADAVLWIALAVAAAAAVVLALVLVRRRTPPDRLDDGTVSRLLDAGQRLTTSLEAAEVMRRAVEEAIALTDAAAGVYVMRDGGTRTVSFTSIDAVLEPADLEQGVVARAIEGGQPGRTVVVDPTGRVNRRAMLAVPVVHGGMVLGALAVSRSAEAPFTAHDQEALSRLAPLVAAGLHAAGKHQDSAELALVDGLTALGNRRRLERDLPLALAAGHGPVAFVMVDVDHFKVYNDTHGHVAGDEALRRVAEALRLSVREGDVVYRYGGEEFCVLLPDTVHEEAEAVCERLRAAVHDMPFPGEEHQPSGRVTVSVGLAVARGADVDALKTRADGALYEAKRSGRDKVVVAR